MAEEAAKMVEEAAAKVVVMAEEGEATVAVRPEALKVVRR